MNKIHTLLRMMEQPHNYSADEWQEILQDDECRELYTLMAKTKSAIDVEQADSRLTEADIEAEWQKVAPHPENISRTSAPTHLRTPENISRTSAPTHLRTHENISRTSAPTHLRTHENISRSPLLAPRSSKIAASFIGLLLISGIAFAAIHFVRHAQMPRHEEQPAAVENISRPPLLVPRSSKTADSTLTQPLVFDNLPLEKMLPEIAAHYNAAVSFQNEEARQLRFYFVWHRDQGLERVVEDLNHFDRLHVTLNNQQIIVE